MQSRGIRLPRSLYDIKVILISPVCSGKERHSPRPLSPQRLGPHLTDPRSAASATLTSASLPHSVGSLCVCFGPYLPAVASPPTPEHNPSSPFLGLIGIKFPSLGLKKTCARTFLLGLHHLARASTTSTRLSLSSCRVYNLA